MGARQIQEIVMIGAGRLATNLGLALYGQGFKIVQVCNRTEERGRKLAGKTGASFTSDPKEIVADADLYILAVADSVIGEMASGMKLNDRLAVHASGTVGMDILKSVSDNIGVFYPVQTFSPKRMVDFRNVPVCIEGNSKDTEKELVSLAGKLTRCVYCLDTDQRRLLHLGAVFASNFTNFLYAISEELLSEHQIPFDLLKPLILQVASNVKYDHLIQSQTGPAIRGDHEVLAKHRELLTDHPDYLKIYNLMSENIIKYKSLHGKL